MSKVVCGYGRCVNETNALQSPRTKAIEPQVSKEHRITKGCEVDQQLSYFSTDTKQKKNVCYKREVGTTDDG
jgi:hypothetical protein